MKASKLLVPILFTALLAVFGCDKEKKTSEITLSETEISMKAAGGEFSVNYTSTGQENAIAQVTPGAEWIEVIDIETPGVVKFNVKSNAESERESTVTFSYGELANAVLTVKQAKMSENPFTFNIKEINTQDITVDVIPEDKDMEYIVMVGDPAWFEMIGVDVTDPKDDEMIFQDDIAYFEQYAMANGLKVEDVIRKYFLRKGDLMGLNIPDMTPNYTYFVYAYGIDMNTLKRTTNICKKDFTTLEIPQLDVAFEIDENINGQTGKFHVIPGNNYDGWWYFDVPVVPIDEETGKPSDMEGYDWDAEVNRFMMQFVGQFINAGWELDQIFNSFFHKGDLKLQAEMPTKTEFYAIVVGVNDEGWKCTPVSKVRFKTGDEVIPSENKITLKIDNVDTNSAQVITETTVGCDTYAFRAVKKRDVEGMTPEQIAEHIISIYILDLYNGNQDLTITNLNSGTDYLGVAFGYWEFVVTTDVVIKEFTTESTAMAELEMNVEHGNWYDIDAVADLEPKYNDFRDYDAFYPVKITTEPQAEAIYLAVYTCESSDYISDEDMYGYLKNEGARKELTTLILSYNVEYRLYAYAVDGNDEYTPIFRSEKFVLTPEGCSPAQDLLDLMNSYKAPALVFPYALEAQPVSAPVVEAVAAEEMMKFDLAKKYEHINNPEHQVSNVRLMAR